MLEHHRSRILSAVLMVVVLDCQMLLADRNVKVSPSDELLIIDPNQDAQNRPTPNIVPDSNGNQRIEIPPTVIVHRYYYSGDREFQGPMIPGGATVLVANHPRTGEQFSVHATLMPGAPRIRYCKTCIIYNYNDRSITLDFGLCGNCEPHMVYQRDDAVSSHVQTEIQNVRQTTMGFVNASGIPQVASGIRKRSQDVVLATGQRINTTGTAVFGRAVRLWDSTPPGDLAKPSTRQNAQNLFNDERKGITKELEDTVGTNR